MQFLQIYVSYFCLALPHANSTRFLLISMLHMPSTNAMWSKTNHLASNTSPAPLSVSVYLQKILVQQMPDQENLPDIWPNPSEIFAASHCVMEQCAKPVSRHERKKSALQFNNNFIDILCVFLNVICIFSWIHGCKSEAAIQSSAFPCCCHIGWNFKDFQGFQKLNSRS